MDFTLPQTHRGRRRGVGWSFRVPPRISSPFHDNLDRATNAHEQDRQPVQAPGAFREDSSGDCVGVVVSNIYYDIQTQPAVGGDGLIQGAIQEGNQGFDVLAFPSWP